MRRNWFTAAIVIGIAAIVIAAVAMRLSDNGKGGTTTSATEWANSVCTDLATWKSSISSLASTSGGTLNKDTLKQKLDTAQTATSTLASELKALGRPDLESGAELQQELSSDVDQLQASFDALKQSAQQAAEATSPTAFLQALGALGPKYQALLSDAQATVTSLRNSNAAGSAKSELQAAFDEAPACQQLKSNG